MRGFCTGHFQRYVFTLDEKVGILLPQHQCLADDLLLDCAILPLVDLGFERAGVRKGYYDRGLAGRADAIVMRLDLTSRAL